VLIVDDNLLFRDGVAQILTEDGRFEVVGRSSRGTDAVTAATSLRPDLILMDLRMPGMNGVEAIRQIRDRDATVPIGLLTAFEGSLVRSALAAGATRYLPKDSTPAELCETAVSMVREPFVPGTGQKSQSKVQTSSGGPLGRLTTREIEVLRLMAGGASNPMIARKLGISPKTLRNHVSNIYRKLQIYDRAQAVLVAAREGLIGAQY
jgi:DNA-binding NarL/FixJ family response regulator